MFDIDNQKDGVWIVLSEYLVDLNIMSLKRFSCCVPTDEFFLLTDLNSLKRLLFSSLLPFARDTSGPRTKYCFGKDPIQREWHSC